MKIKVYVDGGQRNANGEMTVYFAVSNRGKRFMVSSGLTTTEKFSGREFPRSVKNHGMKTLSLGRKLVQAEEYCLRNEGMSMQELKAGLAELLLGRTPKGERSFAELVRTYGNTKRTQGTRVVYEQAARKVERFDGSVGLDGITAEWLGRFETHYLQSMSVNGLAIVLRTLRSAFNWCIDEGMTERYPFRRFKIKEERVPVRNITAATLAKFRDWPVEPWQEIYRDLFMLSFYFCGVNAGDLLECKSLTNGRFVYHRKKTGRLYNLPVYPEAQAIIDKYKGRNWLLSPMDGYTNYSTFLHHWNDGLRKIGEIEHKRDRLGKMRKIEYHPLVPDMTTYTARYTFASIAAELEIPRETIALCLGHSWSDVTSHYVVYDVTRRVDEAVRRVIDYVNSIG